MIFYNAKINTVSDGIIPHGCVTVENGKIVSVSEGEPYAVTEMDINCGGRPLLPGFIDIHSHIGMIGDGQSIEGEDVNEDTDPVTPHLRAQDGLCFTDRCFEDAVRSGVTCAVTGVGSANPIGGSMIAVKTCGRYTDEMMIRTVAVKFALGENPKSVYRDRDETPVTRMASAALIREALFTARRYMENKENAKDGELPDLDMKSEALIPVLKREVQAHFHCHRADDIMTAVRIAEEFQLDYLLIHCTEGHIVADILGEKKAAAAIGPIICDRGKPELAHAELKNAAELSAHGVKVAVCTDHPEVPVQYLALSAAYCAKGGLDREEALKAITLYPAEIAGLNAGCIRTGKDADMILLDGDPFDIMTNNVLTVINGKIVYDKLSI